MHIETLKLIATVVLAIWAPIGPLVGIAISHWLNKNWQRRQWELDNIKGETRELLTAFNSLVPAFTAWMYWIRFDQTAKNTEGREEGMKLQSTYSDKSVYFYSILRDRLFIIEEVKTLEIRTRWESALKDFNLTYNESALEKAVEEICASIVDITYKRRIK